MRITTIFFSVRKFSIYSSNYLAPAVSVQNHWEVYLNLTFLVVGDCSIRARLWFKILIKWFKIPDWYPHISTMLSSMLEYHHISNMIPQ